MTICIATGLYEPDIGGPATYTKLLEERLPQHDIRVKVVSFGWVRRYPVGIRHLLFIWLLFRFGKHADLFYALDPISVGFPVFCTAMLLRKPYLVRVPGDYAWEQGVQRFNVTDTLDVFSRKWTDYLVPVLILKKIEQVVCRYATRVIVPSTYLQGIVSNWGIETKKIDVIYSAAEEVPFQGRKGDFRHMLKFDGKVVISAGRLVSWKGFETLISIVPQLIKEFPSFKLLIVGSGPLAKKLEKMVAQKKLNEYVSLTGALPKEVLFKYIRMADVFVLNTNYEGFSHQLLEVMSIGTPIVTTDSGGNPELISDGKNGLLVQYNNKKMLLDSIGRVLRDQTLGNRLVRNGKQTLKQFTPDIAVTRLISVIKKYL